MGTLLIEMALTITPDCLYLITKLSKFVSAACVFHEEMYFKTSSAEILLHEENKWEVKSALTWILGQTQLLFLDEQILLPWWAIFPTVNTKGWD